MYLFVNITGHNTHNRQKEGRGQGNHNGCGVNVNRFDAPNQPSSTGYSSSPPPPPPPLPPTNILLLLLLLLLHLQLLSHPRPIKSACITYSPSPINYLTPITPPPATTYKPSLTYSLPSLTYSLPSLTYSLPSLTYSLPSLTLQTNKQQKPSPNERTPLPHLLRQSRRFLHTRLSLSLFLLPLSLSIKFFFSLRTSSRHFFPFQSGP